ncbi:MAG: hypothetical protein DMF88_17160, partial [Acidobacteria bacterium]
MVVDVHVEPLLRADERREQADGTGARNQRALRRPGARSPADLFRVIPGLGDDARRLEEHAEVAERGIDLHREAGLDAKAIRGVAVTLLDPSFCIPAIRAHIPLA